MTCTYAKCYCFIVNYTNKAHIYHNISVYTTTLLTYLRGRSWPVSTWTFSKHVKDNCSTSRNFLCKHRMGCICFEMCSIYSVHNNYFGEQDKQKIVSWYSNKEIYRYQTLAILILIIIPTNIKSSLWYLSFKINYRWLQFPDTIQHA